MNWEETIEYIRSNKDYAVLVDQAYLSADLTANVENYYKSEEFSETWSIIQRLLPGSNWNLLDVGCGNGISSIAFAKQGLRVTGLDPDRSESVGTGALLKLKEAYKLDNVKVVNCAAEEFSTTEIFDIVYCRQAMHHANHLKDFLRNIARCLRPGGLLLTVRDHVVYDNKDKVRFLREHPLHKFYGGENAYTASQYKEALRHAGVDILNELKYKDSVINYYPFKLSDLETNVAKEEQRIRENLRRRLGWLGSGNLAFQFYKKVIFDPSRLSDESAVAGRMYTYICRKK
jgi:SAM-dependent methyltransferase